MKQKIIAAALTLALAACGGGQIEQPTPKIVMPPPVLCSSAPGSTEVNCTAWGK